MSEVTNTGDTLYKHDWHDYEGAKYLLEHGADPKGPRERLELLRALPV